MVPESKFQVTEKLLQLYSKPDRANAFLSKAAQQIVPELRITFLDMTYPTVADRQSCLALVTEPEESERPLICSTVKTG